MHSKKKIAAEQGAVTELPKRVTLITEREHVQALTVIPNPTGYIQMLKSEVINQLDFMDGQVWFEGGECREELVLQSRSPKEASHLLDFPLLRTFYTILFNNSAKVKGDQITIYLPTLCDFLGMEMRKKTLDELFKKIDAFRDVIGIMGKNFYKVLEFVDHDETLNCLTFSSPYIMRLLQSLGSRVDNKTREKGASKKKPAHCFLIHSEIYKERNKAAIEIVVRLVTLLQQRGTALKTTTCNIRFSTIIKDIPLLDGMIENQNRAADKNIIIRRAFSKAFELMKNKTDLYCYYRDLVIPTDIPTTSKLNDLLIVTHKGINLDFKSQTDRKSTRLNSSH